MQSGRLDPDHVVQTSDRADHAGKLRRYGGILDVREGGPVAILSDADGEALFCLADIAGELQIAFRGRFDGESFIPRQSATAFTSDARAPNRLSNSLVFSHLW